MPWPEASPKDLGINAEKFEKFVDYAFSKQEGFSTNVLFVLYKGKVIHYSTANGFKWGQVHRQWSASKSVMSLLVGIAKEKGLIDLEDPVSKYYSLHSSVTQGPKLKHLLEMTSGFDWKEGYAANPLASDVIAMLYTEGFTDMASFCAKRPLAHKPGDKFVYASGNSNLLMGVLKKVIPESEFSDFPWKNLFDPLGIKSATWEKDQSGNFVGSSYLYIAPEDMAKIGYMVLKGGNYFGKQIVSKNWIDYSSTLAGSYLKMIPNREPVSTYGAHWWLNKTIPGYPGTKRYHALPEDVMMAQGYQGQFMLVAPSLDLVVVRNSADRITKIDKDKFYRLLLDALP